jgi:predicted AAA+ superfamily ATPase
MIIYGQNGVGKSTLLYAVKQSILENVVKNEDVIFISPLDRVRCYFALLQVVVVGVWRD